MPGSDARRHYADLDPLLDALLAGDLDAWELPRSVAAWLWAGHWYGRESRRCEVEALSAERDRLADELDDLAEWLHGVTPVTGDRGAKLAGVPLADRRGGRDG